MHPLKSSWDEMWKSAGADRPADSPFNTIIKHYSEPHRKHHNLQHIAECLDIFELVADVAEHPEEVRIALWYHDVVYDTHRSDNEDVSANRAYLAASALGINFDKKMRIGELVKCTDHRRTPITIDEKLIVDVDLAILGTNPVRFDEYERQIKEEYSWVPDDVFWVKRKEILQSFLDRSFIYSTPRFRVALEKQAHTNIAHSLLHK